MGKNNKMKMTHKAKSNPSKNKKSSNSKHLASKTAPKNSSKPAVKSSLKPAAKPVKKEFENSKKSSFAQSHKNAKPIKEKDKKTAPASFKGKIEVKKTGYSHVAPVKGHKKEIKIEVSSFKKEHLKKLEQKKREQEKNLELKNQKLKEDNTKNKKTEIHAKPAATIEPVKAKTEPVKAKKVEPIKVQAVVKEKDSKKQKAQKPKETEEELDDVFLSDDDGSEIEEYAEDLKAVEEADLEIEDSVVFETETKEKNFEEINLTDAEGNLLCRARDCDQIANVDGYCRYHYLLYWKKIQVRKKILTEGKLDRYVDELTARYPDKFLEMIRRDLRTQKDFLSAIQELEIDESSLENDFEEDTQTFIDEVRGMNETSSIDEEFE